MLVANDVQEWEGCAPLGRRRASEGACVVLEVGNAVMGHSSAVQREIQLQVYNIAAPAKILFFAAVHCS